MIVKLRKHIVKIFPIVAIVLLAALLLSRVFSPNRDLTPEVHIDAAEAVDHIDKTAKVCGYVASARFVREIGGQPTFINFEKPHPDQVFTVVIWGEHRPAWRTPPEQLYENRAICATGRIRMHEGTPQIVVENPDQISLPR